jgi:hypothetical protein
MDIVVEKLSPVDKIDKAMHAQCRHCKKGSGFIPKIKTISFKGLTDCGLAGALFIGLFLSQQDE